MFLLHLNQLLGWPWVAHPLNWLITYFSSVPPSQQLTLNVFSNAYQRMPFEAEAHVWRTITNRCEVASAAAAVPANAIMRISRETVQLSAAGRKNSLYTARRRMANLIAT